jgi:hypothetical protein
MLILWRIQVDANSYDDTTVVSIAARVSSPINSLQPGLLKAGGSTIAHERRESLHPKHLQPFV